MKITINRFGFRKHECPAFSGIASIEAITQEQMLFGAHPLFALKNGGPLTTHATHLLYRIGSFQQRLSEDKEIVIDTRITQCMEGFFPSIGGWHCDGVPRDSHYGQPDFSKTDASIRHYMILVSSIEPHSETEFINERFEFKTDPTGKVYSQLDTYVNHLIAEEEVTVTRIETGSFYEFDQTSVHRATPAITPGWRFFFRASVSDRKPVNQIRKQVQVYISRKNWGW